MSRLPSWLRWAVLGTVVLGVVVLIGRPDGDGAPLDPDGNGELGARALVLLLEDLGAEVEVREGRPSEGDEVILLLGDSLDEGGRDAVRRQVEAGATLVVADPSSPLQPFTATATADGDLDRRCDVPALAEVERVDATGGVAYDVTGDATGCFPAGSGAFLALVEAGDGAVAAMGGAGAFTNGSLGDEDNAVLAGALLAPRPGTRVAILGPPAVGDGERSLGDLVAPGVRGGLFQLAIAFLVYALWRARRLGGPVPEPQPVALAASELVVAVGNLLQQAGRRDEAGALLRSDLRRALVDRLGLPIDTSIEVVAQTAADRTGLPVERLRAALEPLALRGDEELVALSAEVSALSEAVAHG